MKAKITATGSFLPEKILTNNDISKMVDTTDDWITSRTGIKQRHIASETEFTSTLATKAAENLLIKNNINKETIDCIIVATATPDYTFPSVATIVQKNLGIKNAFAFDIQAVCSGFLYALTLAESFILSKKASKILVIGSDTFSKILDWNDRNTCVLFGDGAGCVLLEKTEDNDISGILGSKLKADGNYVDFLITTGGPSTTQTAGVIKMNGAEVYKHAVLNMSSVLNELLCELKISKNQIDWLIPHQANIRIINSMGEKLGLKPEKIIITVNKHANTSAASIPLAIDDAVNTKKLTKGDLIVLEAMGGGFTWGAMVLKW